MIKILSSVLLLASYTLAFCQPVINDESFNVFDNGAFGDGSGFDSKVRDIAFLENGSAYIVGDFQYYNGVPAEGIVKVHSDGSIDNSFSASVFGSVRAVELQGDGKILIAGNFTAINSIQLFYLARLNIDGTIDPTFSHNYDYVSGLNAPINDISILDDGKIIVAGEFSSFGGINRNRIAKLNASGSLDTTFLIGTGFNNFVNKVAITGSGSLIIGGNFTNYNGTNCNRIAKLEYEQASNSWVIPNSWITSFGTGANGNVLDVKIGSNGEIFAGGEFTTINGIEKNRLVKLQSTGGTNSSFNIGSGFNGAVRSIEILSNGKMVIAGSFSTYNGSNFSSITRLLSSGAADLSFLVNEGFGTTSVAPYVLKKNQNDQILAGGQFSYYNLVRANNIVRIDENGAYDPSFNPTPAVGASGSISEIMIQPNQKILIGGSFTSFNGAYNKNLVRLNSDGSKDFSFLTGTGFNDAVNAIAIQDDGKIIVGGRFTTYNSEQHDKIIRLNSDGTVDYSFDNQWQITTISSYVVSDICIQSDGKIIAVGLFNISISGVETKNIVRFNTDGTVDETFIVGSTAEMSALNNSVIKVIIDANEKIYLIGYFTSGLGTSLSGIVRLNMDGTIDNSFNTGNGFNGQIKDINIQENGKILVCGDFTSYNGSSSKKLIRLNEDGSKDLNFDIGSGFSTGTFPHCIEIQSNGKILIGGNWNNGNFNSTSISGRILRLFENGNLDGEFDPQAGFDDVAERIVIQHDDRILITGDFHFYNETYRNKLARLISSCETPAPTGEEIQSFCNSAILAQAQVEGINLQWFEDENSLVPISPETIAISGNTYYTSQTIGNCESENRLAVTFIIASPEAPTGSSSQHFCEMSSIADLSATGDNIQWYSSPSSTSSNVPLNQETTLLNSVTYYGTQTIDYCESATFLAVTVQIGTPAPLGNSLQEFCYFAQIQNLIADGSNITWYLSETDNNPLSLDYFLENGQTYFATQNVNDCESFERLEVMVSVHNPPPPVALTPQILCEGSTLSNIEISGNNIQWYNDENLELPIAISNVILDGNIYFATQTDFNCESIEAIAVNVLTNPLPYTSISQEGNTLIAIPGYDSYQWINCTNNNSIIEDANSYIFEAVDNGEYAVQISDNNCNSLSECIEMIISSNQEFSQSQIQLWPNPTSNEFQLFSNLVGSQYKIYDFSGNYCFSGNIYSTEQFINITSLSSGLYFITINNLHYKFIKIQ